MESFKLLRSMLLDNRKHGDVSQDTIETLFGIQLRKLPLKGVAK